MTSTNRSRWAFIIFHLVLAVVVFIEGIVTVFHSLHSTTESYLATALPWFAGIKAMAAVLLLVPQTLKIGGAVLLAIFAVAIVIHGPVGQIHLLVYAAAIVLILATYRRTRSPSGHSDEGNA